MFFRDRQTPKGLNAMLGCLLATLFVLPGFAQTATQVEIDLDRNTAGVQSQILDFVGGSVVQGSIVVTGADVTTVADYAIEINLTRSAGGDAVNCANSSVSDGEITSAFASELCAGTFVRKSNLFVNPAIPIGADGVLVVFNFDTEIMCNDGESVVLDFTSTATNSQLGITVDGDPSTFGDGTQNPIDTASATIRCGQGGEPTVCADAGYYILDALGGRHPVGNPVSILGSLYYGRDVAEDMENTLSGAMNPDLAVLDTFGAVQYVANATDTPGQTFYWPEGSDPACGFAVDVEVANDYSGFWVLTEKGGIYRAGSALPGGEDAQLGNNAADLCNVLGIPFGGAVPRDPNLPAGDNASIRAVGFVVVQSGDAAAPTGFVVLDSQGGHYIYDGSGNTSTDNTADSILNPAVAYPFFKGLDIARDIELPALGMPAGKAFASTDPTAGLVIYDGWGGIHPVPVTPTANSLVAFLRNDGLTTAGLPYIKFGFNDPATPEDEGDPNTVGIDVGSIFKDIEFCAGGSEGVYVLDGFGAVFAFGSTRANPDNPAPAFTGGPYFFPNIYAKDLEATIYEGQFPVRLE